MSGPGTEILVEIGYVADSHPGTAPAPQFFNRLSVTAGSSVGEVIELSGITEVFPETTSCEVGIFGKLSSRDQIVEEGDRVELYRPLKVSPMEARRLRAAQKSKRR